MLPTICPYLLKPISSKNLSREYVIPNALGGPIAFSVKAGQTFNSNFGSGLDAAFVNDDLLRAAAYFQIKTGSGPARMQVKDELKFELSSTAAAIEFHGTGNLTLHLKVPAVKINGDSEIFAVRSSLSASQTTQAPLARALIVEVA